MSAAKNGDSVKTHYTGKLESGKIFDSSEGKDPLAFTIGEGNLIAGFEKGVVGMEVGESKTINIPPEEAYGLKRKELVAEVPIENFPENVTPVVGQGLQLKQPDGTLFNVTVAEVNDTSVVLDANHPLAGETLIFEIELVAIN